MAARAQRVDPYTLFSDVFTLSTYRYTYQASIRPVIVRDLEPGPGCLPPLISKKRGRPKTTRIRKQEKPQKEGHNKRSCRTANYDMVLAHGQENDPKAEAIRRRSGRECRRRIEEI